MPATSLTHLGITVEQLPREWSTISRNWRARERPAWTIETLGESRG